jgi:hypothetical protein
MEDTMSTLRGMETDFFELLTRCIREKDANALVRLAEQEAELKERKCTNPEIGKWIDAVDFPFLIETLMLSDAVFTEEYPKVKLSEEERKRFARALETHCEIDCPHCGLKRASDLEWQNRVNSAIAENKEVIGEAIAHAAGKR